MATKHILIYLTPGDTGVIIQAMKIALESDLISEETWRRDGVALMEKIVLAMDEQIPDEELK